MVATQTVIASLVVALGPWFVLASPWGAPTVDIGVSFPDRGHVSTDIQQDHIWFSMPTSSDFINNGVYASTQWAFEDGTKAYMGTQIAKDLFSGEYTQAIFSIWDKNSYMQPIGSGGGCKRFGGEGTGLQCIVKLPIFRNVKYTMQVRLMQTSASGQTWQGTISNGRQTTVVGNMYLKNAGRGMQGWGKIRANGMASFYENFHRGGLCSLTPYSKVGLIGPFLSQRSVRPVGATALYVLCDNADCQGSIPGQPAGPNLMCSGGKGVVKRHSGNLWPGSDIASNETSFHGQSSSLGADSFDFDWSQLRKQPVFEGKADTETSLHGHNSSIGPISNASSGGQSQDANNTVVIIV